MGSAGTRYGAWCALGAAGARYGAGRGENRKQTGCIWGGIRWKRSTRDSDMLRAQSAPDRVRRTERRTAGPGDLRRAQGPRGSTGPSLKLKTVAAATTRSPGPSTCTCARCICASTSTCVHSTGRRYMYQSPPAHAAQKTRWSIMEPF